MIQWILNILFSIVLAYTFFLIGVQQDTLDLINDDHFDKSIIGENYQVYKVLKLQPVGSEQVYGSKEKIETYYPVYVRGGDRDKFLDAKRVFIFKAAELRDRWRDILRDIDNKKFMAEQGNRKAREILDALKSEGWLNEDETEVRIPNA